MCGTLIINLGLNAQTSVIGSLNNDEKYVESLTKLVFGKNAKRLRTFDEWWNAVIEELKRREQNNGEHC